MNEILAKELDFVGDRRKVPWFNHTLLQDIWFWRLCHMLCVSHRGTSTRNLLYALLSHTEYVSSKQLGTTYSDWASYADWKRFVVMHEYDIVRSVLRHGTQGNIPQRAAMIIDYLSKCDQTRGKQLTVIELGCSAGLLGRAFMHATQLFSDPHMTEYTWLTRRPDVHVHVGSYIGVDKVIPPHDLVPYFILDKEKRQRTMSFMHAFPSSGALMQSSLETYLHHADLNSSGDQVILVTAFVLYHYEHPGEVVRLFRDVLDEYHHVHWLDLSRAEVLAPIYDAPVGRRLQAHYFYLRHNGEPVSHVTKGSDDCPNWVYVC